MTVKAAAPRITILGASGLIGQAVAEALHRAGFPIQAVARRFTVAQAAAFGTDAVVSPLVGLDAGALAGLIADRAPDIVLNCIGALQDGPRGATRDVHTTFVSRLLVALAAHTRPILLIHVSIPGAAADDVTAFSRTKREAETLIGRSALPFVILRPGFVIAANAYGGSALLRGLAALPLALPGAVAARPFAVTAVTDIAATIGAVARRWQAGERDWVRDWDVMAEQPTTVGAVVEGFRHRFGGPPPRLTMPAWLLGLGAVAGDAAARLGWLPPVRTTALREMARGVEGDPRPWMAEAAISPATLDEALAALPLTIQERWFARLFMLKPLVLAGLAVFWTVSGFIALVPAFAPATAILTARGFPDGLARAITIVTSLMDMSIGVAIGWRRTCRTGLLGGIALSLLYMLSAAILTPALWIEPLGALVKTGPAIVLMLVALAILPDR